MIGINLHEKVDALKKKKCQQKNCLSSNEDRLEVLVLKSTGKNGLMCTECLLDPELLQQLNPVQKYVLPIRYQHK